MAGGKPRLTTNIVNQRLAVRGIRMVDEFPGTSRLHANFVCLRGHQWRAIINSVLHFSNCPQCASNKRKSPDDINTSLRHLGIQLVGEYTRYHGKTQFKCDQGHEWESSYRTILKSKGCPYCLGIILTLKEIQSRLAERGLVLIGKYVNTTTRATFRCAEGHEWQGLPANMLSGVSGCSICRKALRTRIKSQAIMASDDVISAIRILIRESAGGNVELAELHRAEKLIRTLIQTEGVTRYNGLRQEVALSIAAPDMNDFKFTAEDIRNRLEKRGFISLNAAMQPKEVTNFNCQHGHIFQSIPLKLLNHPECPLCAEAEKAMNRQCIEREKEARAGAERSKQGTELRRVAGRLKIIPMEQPCIEWKPQRPYRR